MSGDAESIARALGGAQKAGRGWLAYCPVHKNTRTPSLSLRISDDSERLLVNCWGAHCNPRDILAELRARGLLEGRGDWREPALPRPKRTPAANDDARRTEAALRLWHEALDPRRTRVERYLARRNLALDADLAGRVLRYHPACPFGPGVRLPCMLALYRDMVTDVAVAIHRTAISPKGVKLGRKMLGPTAGAAIKLSADDDVELGLCVGEGVETCLAAKVLGFSPIWATGSAPALGALPVLGGVECLTIMGETDDTGANAREARRCARRWNTGGCDVEVLDPIEPGDANDVLARRLRP